MRKTSAVCYLAISLGLVSCGSGGGSPAPSPSVKSSASSSLVLASSSSSKSASSSSSVTAQISAFIVVDQFGYLPTASKVAVLRDPQTGFDAAQTFTPAASYKLINTDTGETVFTGAATSWKSGTVDTTSGDKAWWFDFSSVTTPGNYAVVDADNKLRSPGFRIADDVYRVVLKQAVRYFFYQRAGFAKQAPYAETGWTDAASHVGPGQDLNARLYSTPNDASSERDIHGGWYDAGDLHRYTSWHADYLVSLLLSYVENPNAWGDDYNLPDSGNGLPDIIDEIKFGMDWLIRMQNTDGSVLSIAGAAHDGASPPSNAKGKSVYGPASTNATITSASAFALGAKILGSFDNAELKTYAADLNKRAVAAWKWADANPAVLFKNNDASNGSQNIGGGQQETDDFGRAAKKREASVYLFAATGDVTYRNFIDANYTNSPLIMWGNYVDFYQHIDLSSLLYYSSLSDASPKVASAIKAAFKAGMNGGDNWQATRSGNDPYRAYLKGDQYGWGSNSNKSNKGMLFAMLSSYNIDGTDAAEVRNAGLGYVNYLHGVNPLQLVYLSNMGKFGAYNSVNEFYHTWFTNGSKLWDRVGTSTYGPPPGFLTGGPNPSYKWAEDHCGPVTGTATASDCGGTVPTPPYGQPPQKAYKDFNTSWPLNSWEITENSNSYQTAYIRLLSKFVQK